MSDTPENISLVTDGIRDLKYMHMVRFAKLVCHCLNETDRDYDDIGEAEVAKMAAAVLLACDSFDEAWED